MSMRHVVGILCLILLVTLAAAEAQADRKGKEKADPFSGKERWIALTTDNAHKQKFRAAGCDIVHELRDGTAVACPPGLANKLGITFIEDRMVQVTDAISNTQTSADDVHLRGVTGQGIKVAVLDTGVQTSHVELSDSILRTTYYVTNSPQDEMGHGTHVTGIITANGVNPDAKGVAPGALIMSAKVLDDAGYGRYSDIGAGIEWAVSQGADIISMSLGSGNFGGNCDGDYLAAKANWAVDRGVVVVASAGNDNAGVKSPACGSKVIAVGTVDRYDQRASFSNVGAALDLMAPGVGILSSRSCFDAGDCSRTWYTSMSGTSMSAPFVAGVAALMLERNPSLTPVQVSSMLKSTAKNLGLSADMQGSGRVESYDAVNAVSPFTPVCGNRIKEGTEQCDDGNRINGDGCSSNCMLESTQVCGNRIKEGTEQCDDGNRINGDGCSSTCTSELVCTVRAQGKCNCDGKCNSRERRYHCGDCR